MSFATQGCLALALAALCPITATASTFEAAASSARQGLQQPGPFHFQKGLSVKAALGGPVKQVDEPRAPISIHLAAIAGQAQSASPIKEIDLAKLHNRHLKTTLKYEAGGVNFWVSGGFDRAESAFVSILIEGGTPKFFNVKELATSPKEVLLDFGPDKYKLTVSVDPTDLLESEIVLTKKIDRKKQLRITLREMLGAVAAEGEEVTAGGIVYRVFYYDDIKDGVADPQTKSFAFMNTDANGEITVMLIHAEDVPADVIKTFKMIGNKIVGLQKVDGKLRVFDNP